MVMTTDDSDKLMTMKRNINGRTDDIEIDSENDILLIFDRQTKSDRRYWWRNY